MGRPRLQELVSWQLPGRHAPTVRTSAARWLPDAFPALLAGVVSAILSGGDGGSSSVPIGEASVARSRLPRDPAAPVVTLAAMGGDARWLPPRWADRPLLHVTRDAAYVERAARPRIDLDLARSRLTSLTAADAGGSSGVGFVAAVLDRVPGTVALPPVEITHPDDECTATIETPHGSFTANGPWVAVAWLGLVAGWPDPGLAGR
ncbi:hypothetical protein [Luteimicrobium sp. DT211]|uniref:hypothetical protein n=1 Tax=Luteimicrobium sp. DT211 TaxID=3393412 RepID=UPI003CE84A30